MEMLIKYLTFVGCWLCVRGIVPSTLHVGTLILLPIPRGKIIIVPTLQTENGSIEKVRNLPKDSGLLGGQEGIHTHAPDSVCSCHSPAADAQSGQSNYFL